MHSDFMGLNSSDLCPSVDACSLCSTTTTGSSAMSTASSSASQAYSPSSEVYKWHPEIHFYDSRVEQFPLDNSASKRPRTQISRPTEDSDARPSSSALMPENTSQDTSNSTNAPGKYHRVYGKRVQGGEVIYIHRQMGGGWIEHAEKDTRFEPYATYDNTTTNNIIRALGTKLYHCIDMPPFWSSHARTLEEGDVRGLTSGNVVVKDHISKYKYSSIY